MTIYIEIGYFLEKNWQYNVWGQNVILCIIRHSNNTTLSYMTKCVILKGETNIQCSRVYRVHCSYNYVSFRIIKLIWIRLKKSKFWFNNWWCPGLDHIFIWLGAAPPTPPSLPSLPACTYMGTLHHWESMWQYLVTKAIKLLWHVKGLHPLPWE